MKRRAAKLIMVYKDSQYLLLTLNRHPLLGSTPDIPGGTAHADESAVEAMIREVHEETGVLVAEEDVELLYSGSEYSLRGSQYDIFITNFEDKPEIILSWEHSAYRWVDYDTFIKKTRKAIDGVTRTVPKILNKR